MGLPFSKFQTLGAVLPGRPAPAHGPTPSPPILLVDVRLPTLPPSQTGFTRSLEVLTPFPPTPHPTLYANVVHATCAEHLNPEERAVWQWWNFSGWQFSFNRSDALCMADRLILESSARYDVRFLTFSGYGTRDPTFGDSFSLWKPAAAHSLTVGMLEVTPTHQGTSVV